MLEEVNQFSKNNVRYTFKDGVFFLTFGTKTPQKFLFAPTLDCCQPLTFGIVLQAGTRFPPQSQGTSFSVKETNSSPIVNLLQNFCFEYAYMPYPHQVD